MQIMMTIVVLAGLLVAPLGPEQPEAESLAAAVQHAVTWNEGPNMVVTEWWNAPGRAGCMYAANPWPRAQLAAERALVLAARQVLHDEWRISDWIASDPNASGYARILGTETDCFNGHIDYPPHLHIIYQWTNPDGSWRHVNSHLYPDASGRVTDNFVIPDACRPGRSHYTAVNAWVDILYETCSPIWQQRFTDAGTIELRRSPGAPTYAVRVTGVSGDLSSAEVLQGNTRIAAIDITTYDPVGYRMQATIRDYARGRVLTETWQGDPAREIMLVDHSVVVGTTPPPPPPPVTSLNYRLFVPFNAQR